MMKEGKLGGGGNVTKGREGQLLGPDGEVIQLHTQLTYDDKRKLVTEITEKVKSYVSQVTVSICDKTLEPLKRNVRNLEADKIVFENRIKTRVDREVKETIDLFADEINTMRSETTNSIR